MFSSQNTPETEVVRFFLQPTGAQVGLTYTGEVAEFCVLKLIESPRCAV
jgi:hypothetical protein